MVWTHRDNLHSRVVFWLKILLPMAALAILSTLFMVSHKVSPEDAIPYAQTDIASRIKDPRLTDPVYAAMTSDGAALTIRAAEAKPGVAGTDNAGTASDMTGLLETPDGAHTDIVAKAVLLDQVAKVMILSGGVVVTNSAGYRVEMPGARVLLDNTGLDSQGGIKAVGPAGQITASSMHLGPATPGNPEYLLVFKGNVRLLYHPVQ